MKQSYVAKLFFCFFLMMYSLDLASKYTVDFGVFLSGKKNYYKYFSKQYYDEEDREDINHRDNCVDEIFAVLVTLYQKILTAAISHYLMVNVTAEYDLEEKIARIIIDDVTKILKIIGKKIIASAAHPQVSVKKKIFYTVGLVSTIVALRTFISYASCVSEKK